MTHIYTTKKLEKIISKCIEEKTQTTESEFGKWNASVVYIAKKKCLIFVNSKSFYSDIIPRFSIKDLDKIHLLFLENLYAQLDYEHIEVNPEKLVETIGEIKFHATDNDRKLIGILNYNSSKIDYLKYDYAVFNNVVIRELTEKLNLTIFKQLDWRLPQEVMKDMIKNRSN